MSVFLPPPPIPQGELDSYQWRDWFRKLQQYLTRPGSIPSSVIDTTTLPIEIGLAETVQSLSSNAILTTDYYTNYVIKSGLTVKLPTSSSDIIGKTWTINFNTEGTLLILTQGRDTIMTPDNSNETGILVTVKGTSMQLRCITVGYWIIV